MRSARIVLHILTWLGAMIGLVVLYACVLERNWLAALAGLALAVGSMLLGLLGMLLSDVLRQATIVSAAAQDLHALRERVGALEALADLHAVEVDLAAAGRGDPSPLVAATLEHDTYPRIVPAVDAEVAPPRPSLSANRDEARRSDAGAVRFGSGRAVAEDRRDSSDERARVPAALWHRWRISIQEYDVAAARQALAELAVLLDEGQARHFAEDLARISQVQAEHLRRQFGEQIRSADYDGAVQTGAAIQSLFPDSPLADEYRRIRPHLEAKLPAATPPRASAG